MAVTLSDSLKTDFDVRSLRRLPPGLKPTPLADLQRGLWHGIDYIEQWRLEGPR